MANTWVINSDNVADDGNWSGSDSTTAKSEKDAWCASPTGLSPGASAEQTILGWGNFNAEEFNVNPEDVNLEPELVQAGSNGWTVLPEPS